MLRHSIGMAPLMDAAVPYRCPACSLAQDFVRDDITNNPVMAMVDHVPRCPARALTTHMHNGVRDVLVQLLKEYTSVNNNNVSKEPTGLSDGARRLADILLRNFYGQNKHVILDVGVTSAMTNTSMVAAAKTLGYYAVEYEQRKIQAVFTHPVTMRGSWQCVPFVLEDYGRPGVHAQAFLAELE